MRRGRTRRTVDFRYDVGRAFRNSRASDKEPCYCTILDGRDASVSLVDVITAVAVFDQCNTSVLRAIDELIRESLISPAG